MPHSGHFCADLPAASTFTETSSNFASSATSVTFQGSVRPRIVAYKSRSRMPTPYGLPGSLCTLKLHSLNSVLAPSGAEFRAAYPHGTLKTYFYLRIEALREWLAA